MMSDEKVPVLVQLVSAKRWMKAKRYIQELPESIYDVRKSMYGRSILHVICNETYHIQEDDNSGGEEETQDEQSSDEDDGSWEEDVVESYRICEFAQWVIDVALGNATSDLGSPSRNRNGKLESSVKVSAENDESSADVQMFGLRRGQSIFTTRDLNGNTPLHAVCSNTCDPDLIMVLLESSRRISETAPHELITARNNNGVTPLHIIAEGRCPFRAEKLIMSYCSETVAMDATAIQDCDGETPLHWGGAALLSMQRWKLLMGKGAGGLMIQDKTGFYPIDSFFRAVSEAANFPRHRIFETVDLMLRAHFNKLDATDDDWFPIHALLRAPFCRPYVLRLLLYTSNCGDNLSTFDRLGMLPLHVAVDRPLTLLQLSAKEQRVVSEEENVGFGANESNIMSQFRIETPGCDRTMIQVLLNSYTQAAACPTATSGRLALHYAVETGHDWDTIRALWEAAPDVMTCIDPETRLYPFLLAAAAPEATPSSLSRSVPSRCSNCGLDVIYELICTHPELIQSGIP